MEAEKNYFSQQYNAFGGYSPGGRIVDGIHYIKREKLLRVLDYEKVVEELNKRTDLFGGIKKIVIVD